MKWNSLFDRAQQAYDNLSERERKFVAILGAAFAAVIVILPVFLLMTSISDLEDENQEIADLLRDISRRRPQLLQRAAAQKAIEQRYNRQAPALAGFIEEKANAVGVNVRETTPQSERTIDGYRRRRERVALPSINLKPAIKLMAEIENSAFPVALGRVQIEHYQNGDNYDVQLDVIAFDRRRPETKPGEPSQ